MSDRACVTCGGPVRDVPLPEGSTREDLEGWIREKAQGHSDECLRIRLKGLDDALMGIDWSANGTSTAH